jgi:hypothetical protein
VIDHTQLLSNVEFDPAVKPDSSNVALLTISDIDAPCGRSCVTNIPFDTVDKCEFGPQRIRRAGHRGHRQQL